jgi:hypothetical protein
MDIPIPPTTKGLLVDRDNDGQITVRDLWLSLQRLHVLVVSPVANEVIPQGRTPVRYELAGIKLALYDENGLPTTYLAGRLALLRVRSNHPC